MAFLLAFLFLYIWNYLVYTSLLILVQIKFLIHFLFSQVIYQLRLPGDCKSFTFKCSVNATIKKGLIWDLALIRGNTVLCRKVVVKKS